MPAVSSIRAARSFDRRWTRRSLATAAAMWPKPHLLPRRVHYRFPKWKRRDRSNPIPSDGLPQICSRMCEMLVLSVPTLPGNGWSDLLNNRIFVTGFVSWAAAQMLKVFTEYVKNGRFDLRSLVMAGGMPSSHSSACVAVTTSVALQQGLGSPLFAMAFCFSAIVMYDAAGIRRHAGYQAKILNQLMSGLRPELGDQTTLKEVLGHSRREVLKACRVALPEK